MHAFYFGKLVLGVGRRLKEQEVSSLECNVTNVSSTWMPFQLLERLPRKNYVRVGDFIGIPSAGP